MKLDKQKWNQDRLKVEADIKAQKKLIRKGGTVTGKTWDPQAKVYKEITYVRSPGLADSQDYENLFFLKQLATNLYKVRANYRGRQHQKAEWISKYHGYNDTRWEKLDITSEQELQQIKNFMEEYSLPEKAVDEASLSVIP